MNHKKVLLLHGWGGKKEKHWLTWLEVKLQEKNYEVYFPKIPNNYNPNLTRWLTHIDTFVKTFDPEIVIAHSLGALAWWHYQTQNNYPLAKFISVAPPTFPSFPAKMQSFFPLPDLCNLESEHTIIYAVDDKNIEIEVLQKIEANSIERKSGEHLDHFSGVIELQEITTLLQ
jgi:predicted alpha/beta hydrolase family esterase